MPCSSERGKHEPTLSIVVSILNDTQDCRVVDHCRRSVVIPPAGECIYRLSPELPIEHWLGIAEWGDIDHRGDDGSFWRDDWCILFDRRQYAQSGRTDSADIQCPTDFSACFPNQHTRHTVERIEGTSERQFDHRGRVQTKARRNTSWRVKPLEQRHPTGDAFVRPLCTT